MLEYYDKEEEAIRDLIKEENVIFAQRKDTFAFLQGLLWAAIGLLFGLGGLEDDTNTTAQVSNATMVLLNVTRSTSNQDSDPTNIQWLAVLISCMGIISAFDSGIRMTKAQVALYRLQNKVDAKHDPGKAPLVVGLSIHDEEDLKGEGCEGCLWCLLRCFIGCDNFGVISSFFIMGWIFVSVIFCHHQRKLVIPVAVFGGGLLMINCFLFVNVNRLSKKINENPTQITQASVQDHADSDSETCSCGRGTDSFEGS